MTLTISQDLIAKDVFVFLAVFARLGAMLMLFPALGATAIPSQVRLIFALSVSFVTMPVVASTFPAPPDTLLTMAGFILLEATIGIAIGAVVRTVMSALQVAGTIIAFQTGLAFAQNFDPAQDSQSAIYASFLSLLAMTLIFVTDLHHLLIGAMYHSYVVFPPGHALPWGDLSELAVKTVSETFVLGVQMATPFIAAGLLFYLGIGVLSRLMPQVQIFFVSMPANILLGILILFLTISTMTMWFMNYFESFLAGFLS